MVPCFLLMCEFSLQLSIQFVWAWTLFSVFFLCCCVFFSPFPSLRFCVRARYVVVVCLVLCFCFLLFVCLLFGLFFASFTWFCVVSWAWGLVFALKLSLPLLCLGLISRLVFYWRTVLFYWLPLFGTSGRSGAFPYGSFGFVLFVSFLFLPLLASDILLSLGGLALQSIVLFVSSAAVSRFLAAFL
ncbi:hypothetical protein SAMN04487969_104173 [Paenibacillus algorifonticola]|uniref:Uncharacterized protein n=1 Tax=Paenibacillus algorifonticola TaxID=684063 RepID=A0A1I2BZ83_9BACL|nr:hypothetical protein SAMN04487969_104173 [Paenibacillus algorifonticola]